MTDEKTTGQPDNSPIDLPKILAEHKEWLKSDYKHASRAVLTGKNLSMVNLRGGDLSRANLVEADLSGTNLEGANLRGADLSRANLSGANLEGADLHKADLSDVIVNSATKVTGAMTEGCRIQRYTVEMLSELTQPQKMVMIIDDPVATMRSHFSGLWRVIHMVALLLFILPYAAFLLKMSLKARYLGVQVDSSKTLLSALWQFIYTGGEFGGEVAWWPFLIFWFSLAYNLMRSALLFKTVSLEQHETIRRLPAKFSLRGNWGWGWAFMCLKAMFLLNIILVLVHTWHFLQMRVGTNDVLRSWVEILGR